MIKNIEEFKKICEKICNEYNVNILNIKYEEDTKSYYFEYIFYNKYKFVKYISESFGKNELEFEKVLTRFILMENKDLLNIIIMEL